ncbi:uncharacterized protein LOC114525959 [Dendronephthya gigantea]|uniref:uncharacterized protein LOC114525959 n=1 Tax=Dendronephthya gigantea TaxID=151771 RepID=UPI00106CF39D|nr:uncharacterized protein LOC114525959 [Dendronephthya gigantea]
MEVDHLPNRRPPKPIRAPLLSPEINLQLNITPEKKVTRESYVRRDGQSESSYNYTITKENVLSQPHMNTTSIVTKKIKELNQTKFDAPSLVKEELKKSEKLRQDIAEKASEALNYNSKESTHPGLVSLDVSASDLTLQQRKVFKERKASESKEEPDIMSFLSDDLEYESASLSCDCIAESSELEQELFTEQTEDAFSLFELIECWTR